MIAIDQFHRICGVGRFIASNIKRINHSVTHRHVKCDFFVILRRYNSVFYRCIDLYIVLISYV